MRKITSGFTIVELLIVIVVIAILAAITIISYNGIQDRAKAASIVSGINSTTKGLKIWMLGNAQAKWPNDLNLCGYVDQAGSPANNPSITYLIENCSGLNQTLQTSPAKNYPTFFWRYDSDGDTKPSPTTQAQIDMGTNIVIENVPTYISTMVDKTLDDNDPNNGKVRISSTTGNIFYSIAFSPDDI